MVSINQTIFKSILKAIGELRYQAKDDPAVWKSLIELIIVDDMIEWASGLGESEEVLNKLINKRMQIILYNKGINPEYEDTSSAYVNVNTPQSNDTWKRVWDAKDCIDHDPNNTVLPCTAHGVCPGAQRQLKRVDSITIKDFNFQ